MKNLIFLIITLLIIPIAVAHTGHEHVIVSITSEGFVPETITITQGDTVSFFNADEKEHWPASDIHPSHTIYPGSHINKCGSDEDMFDACDGLAPGKSYSFTFDQPGTWKCHDHLNPKLTCAIVVAEDVAITSDTIRTVSVEQSFYGKIKTHLAKVYYYLFPGKLSEKLEHLDLIKLSEQDDDLIYWMSILGPQRILTELRNESSRESLNCHQAAHQYGRVGYALYKDEAYHKGDTSCHSGFYHGAMERMLTEEGTQNITAIAENICDQAATLYSRSNCIHGIGHGVMAYAGYDLHGALGICTEFSTDIDRTRCYGGVFMENTVSFQGLGALPGHDTEWVSDDPHFPCNLFDNDSLILNRCYERQPSNMLTIFDRSWDRVLEECLKAPEEAIPNCIKGMGRDAAGETYGHPERLAAICDLLPRNATYLEACIVAGTNMIVSYSAENLNDEASGFCKVLAEPGKRICYEQIVRRLPGFMTDPADMQRVCDTFEPHYADRCKVKHKSEIESTK